MKRAKHVLSATPFMAMRLVIAALLWACAGASHAKEHTTRLQAFLDQLNRRLSTFLELQQQRRESRQSWCQDQLHFLADEGKRAEGVLANLRSTVGKLENTTDENIMLVQITEDAASNETTNSEELALQLSTKAQLAEFQERLKLRGLSSSASNQFADAVRQACEASERRSAETEKALQEQVSLLQSSTEALSAAEALHGIDNSALTDVSKAAQRISQGEVSFLQMGSASAAELPDILSLFRRSEPVGETEEETDGISLPLQSRETRRHGALPAMPESQRPKVLELLSKMHSEEGQERSKKERWCKEERLREQGALKSARASAMVFSSDALAHSRIQAQLADELTHVQKGSRECNMVLRNILEDSSNTSQALEAVTKDSAVAAKALNKALDGLTSLRDQWWGHATSNPVSSAMTALSAVKQSLEEQAEAYDGRRQESAESAKSVAGRGHELLAALDAEERNLQLTRDFYVKRQRRSESMKDVYSSQVRSAEAYLRNLEQTCGKEAFQQESREMEAEVRALQDADMVFSGQPIKAPHLLRGASKSLSPVEQAALAMGVSVE